MSLSRKCDICRNDGEARGMQPGSAVVTYSVRKYDFKGAVRGYRSAGSIDLCDACWARVCRPRMVPARGIKKGHPDFDERRT